MDNSSLNKNLSFVHNNCNLCSISKQTRLKFSLSSSKSSEIFHLIHINIWGKFPSSTHDRNNIFLTIVEDFST